MIGAIIGDIVGSRFEFDQGDKSREFELFNSRNCFTDDTVMTIAIAEALMDVGKDAGEAEVKAAVIKSMKKWGQKYPDAGYGARFISWVLTEDPKPYGSYGNGSGMRVSPVGWMYDTMERTREVARWTAEVTHNHPEGVKGAEATAAAIFMARTLASFDEIEAYITKEFGYDLTRTLDQIRPKYHHVEDCMHTMPEAYECFLESESYESCLRNVMYIGGDTDTLCAIAGAIAEAYWGIPVSIIVKADEYLTEDIRAVITRFNTVVHGKGKDAKNPYENNKYIKMAVEKVKKSRQAEDFFLLLEVISRRIDEHGQAPTPMVDVNNVMGEMNPDNVVMGKQFKLNNDLRLRMDTMTDENGDQWFPLFTDDEELNKQPTTNITINTDIEMIVHNGINSDRVKGIVINPFGQALPVPKDVLKLIYKIRENS